MAEVSSKGSITHCLDLLKQGDGDAAQAIWQLYIHRLVALARARPRGTPSRDADEEDVVLSAFDCFVRRAERGQFARLEDRDDLWQLLFVLSVRRAANLTKRQGRKKYGGGALLVLSDLEGLGADAILGSEPRPSSPRRRPKNVVGCWTASATMRCASWPGGSSRALLTPRSLPRWAESSRPSSASYSASAVCGHARRRAEGLRDAVHLKVGASGVGSQGNCRHL